MKKNNLFKAIGIVILLYICLSWIIPIIYGITGAKGDVSNQIGFVSIVSVIANTFSGFGNVIFYVLLVGGFYGVLKATGAYDKMMSKLVEKKNTVFIGCMILVALLCSVLVTSILKLSTGLSLLFLILIAILIFAIVVALAIVLKAVIKDKNKLVLVSTILLMTLTASLAGLDLGLLVFFPLIFGYVAKLGYDKVTGVAATVGATIVGMYGSVFANTLYGINVQVLTSTKMGSSLVSKIILLVLGLVLLIALTLMHAKSNVADKKADIKKEKSDKVSKAKKEIGALPALITTGVLFIVLVLGTISWASIFDAKQSIFEKAHSAWTGFTIGGFPILNKLFGGVGAFGTWFDPNRYSTYSILLLLSIVVITLFYGRSVKKSFEGFVEGLKSFIIPITITVLVCSVFVFVYYNPFLNPVTELLLKATDGFNVTLASLYTLINSFFYVDYYYLVAMTMQSMAQKYTDANVQSVLSVMYVSIYSVVMLIAPTSLLLMLGLSISETRYTDWIKFIWILAVVLLLVAFVVLMTMAKVIPIWAGIVIGIVVVIILMAIYAVINHLI